MGFFSGIASAVGDVAGFGLDMASNGAFSNAKGQAEANQINLQQANQQQAFQERMSNSAYQRAVEDMRKAGLNPALAYQNGGASSPSGAAGHVENVRKGDIGANVMNNAKSAVGIAQAQKTIDSQVELNSANTNVAETTALKNQASAKEVQANEQNTRALTKKLKFDTEKSKIEAERAKTALRIEKAEAPVAEANAENDKIMSNWDAIADRLHKWIPFTSGSSAKRNWRSPRP